MINPPSINIQDLTYQRALGVISLLISLDTNQRNSWSIGDLYKLLSISVSREWYEIQLNDDCQPQYCKCWLDEEHFNEYGYIKFTLQCTLNEKRYVYVESTIDWSMYGTL